jgi:hypothetical protein
VKFIERVNGTLFVALDQKYLVTGEVFTHGKVAGPTHQRYHFRVSPQARAELRLPCRNQRGNLLELIRGSDDREHSVQQIWQQFSWYRLHA